MENEVKDDVVYLNRYQVQLLLKKLDEVKQTQPEFKDQVAENFGKDVLQQAVKITSYSKLKRMLSPKVNMLVVSRSMYDYVCTLTGVDPFDKETMKQYMPEFKKEETTEELINIFERAHNKK